MLILDVIDTEAVWLGLLKVWIDSSLVKLCSLVVKGLIDTILLYEVVLRRNRLKLDVIHSLRQLNLLAIKDVDFSHSFVVEYSRDTTL